MAKFTIAITDDDRDDYDILTYAFDEQFAKNIFKYSQNGLQLLEYLNLLVEKQLTLPDIIILDYNMPILNGMQTLEKIKNNNHLKTIPVIIYSTSDCEIQKEKAYSLGAEGWVTKGCTMESICAFATQVLAFLNGVKEIPGKLYK